MKEIGGYLELEKNTGNEYYPKLIALNTGRNALLYILKARNIKKIYLPYFLCDSVSLMCDCYGYNYEYYHVDKDFLPVFDKKLSQNEYLYLVNYYGILNNDLIENYRKIYKNIIVDNVQSFFQSPIEGIDTIYSCRKFFGVPDGAYLSTDTYLDAELETDRSGSRMVHILGRFEDSATEYYSSFKDNDISFRQLPLMKMSKLTHNLLRCIDYNAVCKKRSENYCFLSNELREINKFDIIFKNGTYMYPFYCTDGKKIRKQLSEKKIYIPTLWPNVLEFENCLPEKEFVVNILPLPIDQRYSTEDMKYIADSIKSVI